MAWETEAKLRVDELESCAERLGELGAEMVGAVEQRDVFYDRADHSLLGSDRGLRVRHETLGSSKVARMCFKGPRQKGKYKRRQEIEFEVSSGAEAEELLEALGFASSVVVEKKRAVWALGGCEVCLDVVEGLGCFVEIEGPGEAAVSRVQELMGLGGCESLGDSYASMRAREDR